jgi:pimeloyl-ACP methyl ester carboxylesterase
MIGNIILIVVGAYLLILFVMYLIQEWFLFHPEKLPLYFKFQYSYPFEELTFDTEPGAVINGLIFRVPNSKGVVYYFHGNTRSIKGWSKFSRDFTSKGYDVMMIDYRGFGKSRGKRTERGLYHDAQYAYDWLKAQYGENHIVVYGRSMGSGFAARVAAKNNPKLLILDAPYYSLMHLVQRYLPFLPARFITRFQIRTDQYLEETSCPVYIYHGTRDFTIPFTSGYRLYKLIKERAMLIAIRGGGHNNLRDFPKYHEYLYHILDAVPHSDQEPEASDMPPQPDLNEAGAWSVLKLLDPDILARPD